MSDSIDVVVNGEARQLAPGTTVASLVDQLAAGSPGCAVAVNDRVVPRSGWADHRLTGADRVEVLVAVQGG